MKRLIPLLLALWCSVASAQPRLAILRDPNGGSAAEYESSMTVVRRLGIPYDVFNIHARTWGETGKADSTWFRERYVAIFIPQMDASAAYVTTSSPWLTNFLHMNGAAGIYRSPLSGRWGIPVCALSPHKVGPTTDSANDTAATNIYAAGIKQPGGSIDKPTLAQAGTWRYRQIVRLTETGLDTLYGDPEDFGCRQGTWAGSGTVACLAFSDTNFAAVSCATPDTACSVWRWRPEGGKPGIVYATLRQTAGGHNHGALWMLQYIFSVTTLRPFERITIDVFPHSSFGQNATGRAILKQTHDAMIAGAVNCTAVLPQVSQSDYSVKHTEETRAELRRLTNVTNNYWSPGSNVGGGFNFGHYAATDTVGVRQAFNSMMNTAAREDSFLLNRSKMRNGRTVGASGLVGNWQLKVAADAGIQLIESTLTLPTTLGWSVLNPAGSLYTPHPHSVPGGGTENRSVWSAGTTSWPDAATFTDARVGEDDYAYAGRVAATVFCAATQLPVSVYWHADFNSNGSDPYMAWYMQRLASDFRLFNKVVMPGDGSPRIREPRVAR